MSPPWMPFYPTDYLADTVERSRRARRIVAETVSSIAESIKNLGRLINPILIRPTKDGSYVIVAGKGRAKLAMIFCRSDLFDRAA